MTRFVHIDFHPEHDGIVRIQDAAGYLQQAAARFNGMALLAAPVRRVVLGLRSAAKAWSEARRREAEDEKTRNAALHDARRMADLSRAMNGIAVEDARRYD